MYSCVLNKLARLEKGPRVHFYACYGTCCVHTSLYSLLVLFSQAGIFYIEGNSSQNCLHGLAWLKHE